MSSNQPTAAQQAESTAAVNKVLAGQPQGVRDRAASRAADAMAEGFPCRPDAGRTDHLVRHLFRR